jgi:predicted double-glycine peptidase
MAKKKMTDKEMDSLIEYQNTKKIDTIEELGNRGMDIGPELLQILKEMQTSIDEIKRILTKINYREAIRTGEEI